jgi:hypothetical protein
LELIDLVEQTLTAYCTDMVFLPCFIKDYGGIIDSDCVKVVRNLADWAMFFCERQPLLA